MVREQMPLKASQNLDDEWLADKIGALCNAFGPAESFADLLQAMSSWWREARSWLSRVLA